MSNQPWSSKDGILRPHLVFYPEAEPEEHICFRDIKPTPKWQISGEHPKIWDWSRSFAGWSVNTASGSEWNAFMNSESSSVFQLLSMDCALLWSHPLTVHSPPNTSSSTAAPQFLGFLVQHSNALMCLELPNSLGALWLFVLSSISTPSRQPACSKHSNIWWTNILERSMDLFISRLSCKYLGRFWSTFVYRTPKLGWNC